MFRGIDPDDRDRDGFPLGLPEFRGLMGQIVQDAIDLLNHRLREYFNFHAHVNVRGVPPGNGESRIGKAFCSYAVTQNSVAPACLDTCREIPCVQHELLRDYPFVQLPGSPERE